MSTKDEMTIDEEVQANFTAKNAKDAKKERRGIA